MNFQQSYLYWLAGAVLLIVAVMSRQDKANPRRFTTGLFWGIYGVLFLLGDWTFSLFGDKRAVHIAVGIAVVVGADRRFWRREAGKLPSTDAATTRRKCQSPGNRLFSRRWRSRW